MATIKSFTSLEQSRKLAEILRNIRDKYYHSITQNRWKPSDEQMDALHDAAVYVDKSIFPYPKGILMKLYKQLKKLREE